MAFAIKHLRLTIELDSTKEKYVIEGNPIRTNIEKLGADAVANARIVVDGLSRETTKALTVIEFRKPNARVNTIELEARDGENEEYSTVFIGNIIASLPVIRNDGTLSLEIEAVSGRLANIKVTPPVSVKGEVSVDKLFSEFAQDGGLSYENWGVSATATNCVFIGSPMVKARSLARQIGCDCFVNNNTLVVRPFSQDPDQNCPVISKEFGMLNYPTFLHLGVAVDCLYNPNIQLGKQVRIISFLEEASGYFTVVKMTIKLEAYLPSGGQWVMSLECNPVGGVNQYGRG